MTDGIELGQIMQFVRRIGSRVVLECPDCKKKTTVPAGTFAICDCDTEEADRHV